MPNTLGGTEASVEDLARTIEPRVVLEFPEGALALECGFCSGTGVEPCDYVDDDDRRIFVCQVCDGCGFNILPSTSPGAIVCRVCDGDGRGYDDDGYYAGDTCAVCDGRGFVDLASTLPRSEDSGAWALVHPAVRDVAKARFDSGHYADSVEAAFKHFNARVKACVPAANRGNADGSSLMELVFSARDPIIPLADLGEQSGRDEQLGYMKMFSGAMIGIRNPKAHDLVSITPERALHLLVVASLFCHKLDDALAPHPEGAAND